MKIVEPNKVPKTYYLSELELGDWFTVVTVGAPNGTDGIVRLRLQDGYIRFSANSHAEVFKDHTISNYRMMKLKPVSEDTFEIQR